MKSQFALCRAALLVGLIGSSLLPHGLLAQDGPPRKKVPFLTPPKAIEKMTQLEGFTVNAFAAEPDIKQPFAFCFDDRGRLWIAENLNYESRGSDTHSQGPKGRISILHDTDGDGTFDERKVFIDKIFFPTGLALGFGGVWVGSPPNLLFIPDANRDDVPDGKPKIVLDGWGRHDRHETLNSFIWGPDGWLYGTHGVFTHSVVGKPGAAEEDRVPLNAGVWRYHPTREKFEVFAWGTSNPWGLDFNDHGQAFITACVIPHLWHMIQGGRYQRQGGRHFNPYVFEDIKTVADHRHKSAHGGARFYLADNFPAKFRDRLFMCNIHQHDVMTDVLERKGSGYIGRHGDNFMQSNDPQWLGFNMEVGPDGALYIIDWHDEDICGRVVHHGDTGRIWRISYRGTPKLAPMDLAALSDARLVKLHLHANDWYVRQARRILQERAAAGTLKKETHARLKHILQSHPDVPKKLRALWSLHVTAGFDAKLAAELLHHESEYLRAWTLQLLCEDGPPSESVRETMVRLAREDSSSVVRLYLASACQRMPVEQRWDILTALAKHDEDRDDHNLPLLIWYALEPAVAVDARRALLIAKSSKLPHLARFVTRRITAAALSKKRMPKTVKPAASVSSDGLALWLRADWGLRKNGETIEGWLDRSDGHRDARQDDITARPTWMESLGGRKALVFDGKNDHLVIPHDARLAFGTGDSYTISSWVHFSESQNGWRGLVTKSRDLGAWYGIWLEPSGNWCFGASESHVSGSKATSGWRHVAIVQEGDGGRYLYVDGKLVGRGEAASSAGKGDLWIAGAKSTREFFSGGIGEVRIYRRALGHPEVAYLATQP